MPTYTYRCSACEHQFDQVQRMTEEPLTECPVCGGTIRRVIHPVGVVFKGSGWYITDSRKPAPSETGSGTAEKAKAESTSEPAASAGNDGKGDKHEQKDGGAASKSQGKTGSSDKKPASKSVAAR